MRRAIARGAALATGANLVLWAIAALIGTVPPIGDTLPTVANVAFASIGGVLAAGVVASYFRGEGARRRWNRTALVVLILSFGSPLGLAFGLVPVSPIDPTNALLIAFRGGIGAIYAVMHVTTFIAVQRTIARELQS